MRSDNSEALDSIRSKDDFWEDLEDKKRERYFTKQGKIEREQAEHADKTTAGGSKAREKLSGWMNKQFNQNLVQVEVAKVTKKYEDYIASLKTKYENELNSAGIRSREGAVSYFREKTEAAIAIFKKEQMHMVEQYYLLRAQK